MSHAFTAIPFRTDNSQNLELFRDIRTPFHLNENARKPENVVIANVGEFLAWDAALKNLEEFVRAFLRAIGSDGVVGKERDWYTDDAIQVEWPNKLLPAGAVRTVEDLREAGERGRSVVDRQWYEVTNILTADNKVAVEAAFRATFKVDVAGLSKGEEMVALFAMFFHMRDGRIARHHTYDFGPR